MEIFSKSHRDLQMFCADFWPSAADCQLILTDVGIESGRINMDEPSIMRWLSIIRELMRKDDGSMARLVVVLMKQYPDNKALAAVCAPWTPAVPARSALIEAPMPDEPNIPAGAVLVKKFDKKDTPVAAPVGTKPASDPVPVVVPPDFADEATLVVPRLDTLWEAMIDTERRLVELEKRLGHE